MNLRQFFISHSWWGKLIGAFLGFLVAGPAGALIGILIGNFFDRGLNEHFSRPYWQYHTEKRKSVQSIFFEATFSILGYVAKADGRVSEQEIQMAETVMQEMRLNTSQKKAAKQFFNAGKKTDFSFKNILTLLKAATHDNLELLRLFIEIQYRAARVDGLTEKKLQAMNTILLYLGFSPLHQQYRFYEDFTSHSTSNQSKYQHSYSSSSSAGSSSYRSPFNTLDEAFAILGINPEANKQDVKRAYRRLISQNHPDKLIAQGLPEEKIRVANEKTQKIRKAYEQICANKGW